MILNKRFIKWSFLIVAISVLFGCEKEPTFEFTIGTEGDREIAEITDTFLLGEKIAFELSGNQEIGTPINIIWIKHNDNSEQIIASYKQDIDPTWSWVHYSFNSPSETGYYSFRVFNADNVLLGEGRFEVYEYTN